MAQLLLREIARLVNGELRGDGEVAISDAATLDTAREGMITFADGRAALSRLEACEASAALVPCGSEVQALPTIVVDDVVAAFGVVVTAFHPQSPRPACGIHPQAYVSPRARLGLDTHVLPGAYIADGVEIGAHCWIGPHVTILEDCRIGSGVTLFPHAVLYDRTVIGDRCLVHAHAVLGAYGFGYRTVDGRHHLSAQLGWVEIQADVEIGACSTIDRGTYGPTVVGEGTKIDNHVMIAHNCRIGRHNILCSQVGIAGSSTTGDYVVMAGQVGVPDHVHIGHRAILGAKAGILRDVPDGVTVLGIPATPERQQMQIQASIARLPEMRRELRELRRAVEKRNGGHKELSSDSPQQDAA